MMKAWTRALAEDGWEGTYPRLVKWEEHDHTDIVQMW